MFIQVNQMFWKVNKDYLLPLQYSKLQQNYKNVLYLSMIEVNEPVFYISSLVIIYQKLSKLFLDVVLEHKKDVINQKVYNFLDLLLLSNNDY